MILKLSSLYLSFSPSPPSKIQNPHQKFNHGGIDWIVVPMGRGKREKLTSNL